MCSFKFAAEERAESRNKRGQKEQIQMSNKCKYLPLLMCKRRVDKYNLKNTDRNGIRNTDAK